MKNVLRAAAASLFALPAAAATMQDYGWSWPLQANGDSGAWQVELTPEIYAASADPALRDIEVFNAAGEAVPLAMVAYDQRVLLRDELVTLPAFALPQAARSTDEGLRLHLERDSAGRLHRLDAETVASAPTATTDYVLDASAVRGDVDALQLQWRDDGGDVNAQFAVDASDDLQRWQTLVAAATVLDLHQGTARLSRRTIPLSGAHANYLRLRRIDQGAALPELTVQARTRLRESASVPARRWIAVPFVGTAVDTAANANEARAPAATYTYRLPAPLAAEAARIELGSDNSIARLNLSSRRSGTASGAPAVWDARGELTAFRLQQDAVRIDNDEIALSGGGRAAEWRLQAWQPLDRAPTLTLAWRPDRLVFLARGAGPYRLAAGSRGARRSDYPIDTALAQFRARLGADWQPPLAQLGERATLGGAAALAAPPPPRPWKTWLLWGVLLLGAALVAAMAVHLLRETKPSA